MRARGVEQGGARVQGKPCVCQAHAVNITSPTILGGGTGPHHPHLPREPRRAGPVLLLGCWEKLSLLLWRQSTPTQPTQQEQQFVPFLRKINCGTGVNARTSNEPVTPTGKVGTWKTNTSSSNIIACHAALGERLLKSRFSAHSGRRSGGKPARCILLVSNYIFHILFISSKETSNYYTILSPYHFGRFINYNLGERPHVRLQMRLIKDIF